MAGSKNELYREIGGIIIYTSSTAYKTAIKESSRAFECRVTILDKVYENEDIVDIIIDGNIQPSDGFMIGATTSQSLDLTLLNKGDIVYGTSTIKVEIGLKIGSTIEYIPLGIYNIDDIEKTDYTIKITGFDNMIKFESPYFSSLGDKPTLQQVVDELATKTGVQFKGTIPAYTVKKLEGFSCREVLSYVASLCGGNAVITRDGKFTIVTPKDINYSIGTSNYFDYKREETKYKISKISCQVGEKVLSKGDLGADSMELEFENPWVTESILQDIYNKLNGFEYLGYSMKWQGDLSLDVGDIVTITDKKGIVRKHPILSQKFTYTGGLTSEIEAKGENKNKNSFSSSGNTTNKVDRIVTDLAIVNKALIDVAYIGDLTANNIKFDTASGGTLDLQTLLAKHITGENGQFLNLTIDNVTISNALIKDVIAKNISVEDLKAGRISTNKINISSDDGGLTIVGPTMQFKDNNSKVRVQIGQDSTGNFTFGVFDETGTGVLIDATGVKEKALADGIIKDRMINEGEIGGSKIDISSLITEVNKDTNLTTIKASKVQLNTENQTLEVAFNTLKTQADETKSETESNTTQIGIEQGRIDTLIKDTTITEDGQSITLKDAYSKLEQDVSSITTTVGKHTSTMDDLTTRVTEAEKKITDKAITATVSKTFVSKYDASNTYATKSSMELTANQLKLDFTSSGGYNLVKNSNFQNGKAFWDKLGSPSIFAVGKYRANGYGDNVLALTTTASGQQVSQLIEGLQVGRSYTVSCYIYIGSGSICIMESNQWHGAYTQGTGWQWLSFSFVANATSVIIFIGSNEYATAGACHITAVSLTEGSERRAWTPHPNEVYSGSTLIDASGVTIKNGALKVTNSNGAVTIDASKLMFRLKTWGNGSIVLQNNSQTTVVTIPHNLGVAPIFKGQIGYISSSGETEYYSDSFSLYSTDNGTALYNVRMFATTTQLKIIAWRASNLASSGTKTFYYRYFIEEGVNL